MSQDELARALKVTKNYISLLENERKDPSVELVKKIAQILDIPLVLLLWQKLDLPKGKNKEEREIKNQLDSVAERAQELFARKHIAWSNEAAQGAHD